MKKQRITRLIAMSTIVFMLLTVLVSCAGEQGPQGERGEQGIQGEQGLPGKDGADGKDGVTPTINVSYDGYWIINGVKTEYKAIASDGEDGKDGANGVTPTIEISEDGYWIINGVKTGYKAIGINGSDGKDGVDGEDGKDGVDGVTPTIEISEDGYWIINGEKTEYKAIGTDGANGTNGTNGVDGVTPTIEISEDGYWIINGVKTEYKAIGTDGTNGSDGKDGEDGKDGVDGEDGVNGVGIAKIEFDNNGDLLITFTDGTTQTVAMPEKEEHTHTFGEWVNYIGNESVYCENRLFYRICTECSVLEWKSGTYDNHSFEIVTTAPTCYSKGYDTKTCSTCGKVEIANETNIINHTWEALFCSNNSFHWLDCTYCDEIKEYAEHTLGDDGICTVCDAVVGDTEGIVYDLSADGTYAVVVAYSGTATRIKIAEEYKGVPVKEICGSTFADNRNITSVIIPDSVTSIGDSAFYDCDSLTSITIPDSVTSIGSGAFSACVSLTSVTIGDSVTSIGNYAFSCCYSLTSVTISDSVTSIGSDAFSFCYSLTSVTISDSVTSIGSDAFSYCPELYTEYELGKYVGDSENPYAVLIEITNKNLSTYAINASTKIISSHVFKECTRLTEISIPDSVTSIGDSAFEGCSSLTNINFEGTVEQWNAIEKGNCWDFPTGSYTIYCADAKISKEGIVICYHNDIVIYEAVAPTCTSTGLTEGKHCSVCGEVLVAQTAIGALGHDVPCTEASICNRCGDYIEPQGHYIENFIVDSKIVCSCSKCDVCYTFDEGYYLDGTDHNAMVGVGNSAHYNTATGSQNPLINDNGEYELLKKNGRQNAKMELWIPDTLSDIDTLSAENNTTGHLSFKVNVYTDDYIYMQFVDTKSNMSTNRWTPNGCIVDPFFNVAKPDANGVVKVTGWDDLILKSLTIGDDKFTGWFDVKIIIELNAEDDTITLHYYVDGQYVGSATKALTTLTNAVDSVYILGYNKAKGAGIILDDILFGCFVHEHTAVIDEAVTPTCTETGLTEGTHCSVCGTVLVVQQEVPTIDHVESDWIIDNEATETEDGTRHNECTVCGERLSEEIIPAIGYDYLLEYYEEPTLFYYDFTGEDVDYSSSLLLKRPKNLTASYILDETAPGGKYLSLEIAAASNKLTTYADNHVYFNWTSESEIEDFIVKMTVSGAKGEGNEQNLPRIIVAVADQVYTDPALGSDVGVTIAAIDYRNGYFSYFKKTVASDGKIIGVETQTSFAITEGAWYNVSIACVMDSGVAVITVTDVYNPANTYTVNDVYIPYETIKNVRVGAHGTDYGTARGSIMKFANLYAVAGQYERNPDNMQADIEATLLNMYEAFKSENVDVEDKLAICDIVEKLVNYGFITDNADVQRVLDEINNGNDPDPGVDPDSGVDLTPDKTGLEGGFVATSVFNSNVRVLITSTSIHIVDLEGRVITFNYTYVDGVFEVYYNGKKLPNSGDPEFTITNGKLTAITNNGTYFTLTPTDEEILINKGEDKEDGTASNPYIFEGTPSSITITSDANVKTYYKFTATTSGTMTFTWPVADSWVDVYELDANGNNTANNSSAYLTTSFSFEIEAGKTYRIGLGTFDKKGEFTILIEWP